MNQSNLKYCKDCGIALVERKRIFKNGTKHLCLWCIDCQSRQSQWIKYNNRIDFNIDSIPEINK